MGTLSSSEGIRAMSAVELKQGQLLLIVTGSNLRAEMADRPLAYRLQDRIQAWVQKHHTRMNFLLAPVVCSDGWYLSQSTAQRVPAISLGGPGVNALSAHLADLLPTTHPASEVVIQMDPDLVDLRVCLWGSDHAHTVLALDWFIQERLEAYLRAAATQVEPQSDG